MNNNKQSSIEYLAKELNSLSFDYLVGQVTNKEHNKRYDKILEQAKAMQQEQAQQYAEFCIRCDRESLPILDFNSWIAHNETFGGNNESN